MCELGPWMAPGLRVDLSLLFLLSHSLQDNLPTFHPWRAPICKAPCTLHPNTSLLPAWRALNASLTWSHRLHGKQTPPPSNSRTRGHPFKLTAELEREPNSISHFMNSNRHGRRPTCPKIRFRERRYFGDGVSCVVKSDAIELGPRHEVALRKQKAVSLDAGWRRSTTSPRASSRPRARAKTRTGATPTISRGFSSRVSVAGRRWGRGGARRAAGTPRPRANPPRSSTCCRAKGASRGLLYYFTKK